MSASSEQGRNRDKIRVRVNGERVETRPGSTISDLLEELSLAPDRVAVELNLQIVRRADWATTRLDDGARLEVVQFVGGG